MELGETLTVSTLIGVLRQAFGVCAVEHLTWQCKVLKPSMGAATGGVYRVSGSARLAGLDTRWSLILKILSPSGRGLSTAERDDVAHPLYWKREALWYQSNL